MIKVITDGRLIQKVMKDGTPSDVLGKDTLSMKPGPEHGGRKQGGPPSLGSALGVGVGRQGWGSLSPTHPHINHSQNHRGEPDPHPDLLLPPPPT